MHRIKKFKTYAASLVMLLTVAISGCGTEEIANETSAIQIESNQEESGLSQENLSQMSEEIDESKDELKQDTEETQNSQEIPQDSQPDKTIAGIEGYFDLAMVPAYLGEPYAVINDNVPFYTDIEMTPDSYELYSELDDKGRCGTCIACIGTDIMPVEERGEIGNVKPSGWNQTKYPGLVDGNYLYNRCHLIGYQLTGENDNTSNLITGTRYMNVEGMLPFENMVGDYIKETGNHVLYRVTPVFDQDNMLATGVLMEAESVEDKGAGILYCVFCYNVQPGIDINYLDGSSQLSEKVPDTSSTSDTETAQAVSEVPSEDESVTEEIAAPEPEPAPVQQIESEPSGGMVWVSETGSKYHSINNCGRMNPDKATLVSESTAKGMGLGKCSKCW